MRPLVVDERAKDRIKILIDFAERNIISMDMLLDMVNGKEQNIADIPDFKVILDVGYEVTYSIEQQYNPKENKEILVKHLCVRIHDAGEKKLPGPAAVQMIMNEFGIEDFSTCKIGYDEERNFIELWEPQFTQPLNTAENERTSRN